jgi:hypothetical protein
MTINMDIQAANEKKVLNLHKLEEIWLQAYDNAKIYKERTKRAHDKRIMHHEFKGDLILLFNLRLRLFSDKLKFWWSKLFVVKEVYPFRAINI